MDTRTRENGRKLAAIGMGLVVVALILIVIGGISSHEDWMFLGLAAGAAGVIGGIVGYVMSHSRG